MNPIDSHHYWMRSHAQLNEMNKVLGLRGAQTVEELAEIAKGGFFGNQLHNKLKSAGYSDEAAGNAVEIYNQVVFRFRVCTLPRALASLVFEYDRSKDIGSCCCCCSRCGLPPSLSGMASAPCTRARNASSSTYCRAYSRVKCHLPTSDSFSSRMRLQVSSRDRMSVWMLFLFWPL